MSSKNPRLRFDDIIDNIEWILADTRGFTKERFVHDRKTQDSVLYSPLRISEAAVKLGEHVETLAPGPPWQQIRSTGNYLRHGYDSINLDVIWDIIRDDLPVLQKACEKALEVLSGD